jgi:hypothetical protein
MLQIAAAFEEFFKVTESTRPTNRMRFNLRFFIKRDLKGSFNKKLNWLLNNRINTTNSLYIITYKKSQLLSCILSNLIKDLHVLIYNCVDFWAILRGTLFFQIV